jgi:Rad3-related DNA helicase
MDSSYRAEVTLSTVIFFDDLEIKVEGRADGIIEGSDGVTIDEIKGVQKDLNSIVEPPLLHLAQARCYGYIYAKDNQLDEIKIQVTYCQLETEDIKRFIKTYKYEELEEWFLNLMSQYERWARFTYEWRIRRNKSIRKVDFPFPYREGQKELVTSVYKTILRKKKLFIQAPTGVGKTIATVFPAVKAVGEELGEKIFYLTAKTIARTVAEQTFDLLKDSGLEWKSLTLTAKDKVCFYGESNCNPEYCIYAKGHYDRVNDAIYDMITSNSQMKREDIENQAIIYQVCPFELSLDISLWVDSVICDYNYVFDPNAYLKRFFSTGNNTGYIFLIDEAHNLVERGREMYSATIYKEDIMAMRKLVKDMSPKLVKGLGDCNKQLLVLKKECESWQLQDSVSNIALKLMNVLMEFDLLFEKQRKISASNTSEDEKRKKILEFYFQVRHFLGIHELLDENFTVYTEHSHDGKFKLKLYCINPAANLQRFLEQGNSTVFFSATLLPIHYYKRLLSVETEDYAIYAKSIFQRKTVKYL